MIIGETPLPSGALGVEAVGMTKRFGAFAALDDVVAQGRPGSFHALLGENGAGKSTLVKCIMGYYHADRGRRPGRRPRAGDREPEGRARARARHGLPALYAGAGDDGRRKPGAGARRRARRHRLAQGEAASSRRFWRGCRSRCRSTRRVSDISAGEKQKLRDPQAALSEAALLILDEPTSVLTPGEADEVLGMLRAMVARGELTVLMITHKFREVMAFADDVTVLRRGKLAGHGARRRSHAGRYGAHHDRRRATDGAAAHGSAKSGEARLELQQAHRARRCRRGRGPRRLARRSAAARSSALPASPATASGSLSKCWPASARPKAARSASAATLSREPRGDAPAQDVAAARRSR